MTSSFPIAYHNTAPSEGGYVNDPEDRGGETYCGISRRFWPNWAGWDIIDLYGDMYGKSSPQFISALRESDKLKAEEMAFYKENYWDKCHCGQMPQAIANEIYDTAVNQGERTAQKFLQEALNLFNNSGKLYSDTVVDGKVGFKTLIALKSYLQSRDESVLLKTLNTMQGQRYIEIAQKDRTQERFVYGWFKQRITILILVSVSIAWLSGCTTYQNCFDKFGEMSSDSLPATAQAITPQDSSLFSVPLQQLLKLDHNMPPIIFKDVSSGGASVEFWKSKYEEELNTRVICPADTSEVIYQCPPQVVFNDDPIKQRRQDRKDARVQRKQDRKDQRVENGGNWFKRTWTGFANFCGVLVLIILLIVIVLVFLRTYLKINIPFL